jgi:hypothetical protein
MTYIIRVKCDDDPCLVLHSPGPINIDSTTGLVVSYQRSVSVRETRGQGREEYPGFIRRIP